MRALKTKAFSTQSIFHIKEVNELKMNVTNGIMALLGCLVNI